MACRGTAGVGKGGTDAPPEKAYLAITSLIGLAALAAGAQMLITASSAGLTAVMAATAVLWLTATIHHSQPAKTGLPQQPARHRPRPAGAH